MLEGWRCCRTHERAREAEQSGKKRLEEITFGHFGSGKWVFCSPNLLEAAQDELLSFQCILGLSAFSGFAKLALEVGCFELLMSKSSHKTQTKRP